MPERWTRAVLRHRSLVVAVWILVSVAGIFSSTRLPGLSSNTFSVPGTDSERAQAILEHSFGERPDGTFDVAFRVARPSDKAAQRVAERRLDAAASTDSRRARRAHRDGNGRRLRPDRHDAPAPRGEGLHRRHPSRAPRPRRPRRPRHGRSGAAARPRPDRVLRPSPRGADRPADRARGARRDPRLLGSRADPVPVRSVHDRRRAGRRLCARTRAGDGDLRHEPRRAHRSRTCDRLLPAGRAPLSHRARRGRLAGGRRAADDGDGWTSSNVLGARRRHWLGRAPVRPRAVRPLARDGWPPRSPGLARRRRDPAARPARSSRPLGEEREGAGGARPVAGTRADRDRAAVARPRARPGDPRAGGRQRDDPRRDARLDLLDPRQVGIRTGIRAASQTPRAGDRRSDPDPYRHGKAWWGPNAGRPGGDPAARRHDSAGPGGTGRGLRQAQVVRGRERTLRTRDRRRVARLRRTPRPGAWSAGCGTT